MIGLIGRIGRIDDLREMRRVNLLCYCSCELRNQFYQLESRFALCLGLSD
jgi:hypothetical protein